MNFKGVVMQQKPPIDKVAAKVIFERALGKTLPVAKFWDDAACSESVIRAWEAEGLIPIDIGDLKYHNRPNGARSATEFASAAFEREMSHGEARLVTLINAHIKTGSLKGHHMSAAWTMRELYEIGRDPIEVVERAGEMIHAWLRVEDGERLEGRTDEGMVEEFADILPDIEKGQFAPFTPHRYLRDLWRLGRPVEEIRERVNYWREGWHEVKREMAKAEAEFWELDRAPNEFAADGLRCFWLETSSKLLQKVATRAYDLVVIRNPAGNIAIVTNNFNTRDLAEELKRQEPRFWYDGVKGWILNGSVMYTKVPPTKLSRKDLVAVIQKCPPRRPANLKQFERIR